MYLYFQLENTLRLFKVMKMIFKKCIIRIVKGTSNLTSTTYANLVIRRLYRYSFKMCSVDGYDQNEMQYFCIYYSMLQLSFVELSLH